MRGMGAVVTVTPQGQERCCGNRIIPQLCSRPSGEQTAEGEQPGMDGTSRGDEIQCEMDVVF